MEEVVARLTSDEAKAVIEVADASSVYDQFQEHSQAGEAVDALSNLAIELKGAMADMKRLVRAADDAREEVNACLEDLVDLARRIEAEVKYAQAGVATLEAEPGFDCQKLSSAANKLDLARYARAP